MRLLSSGSMARYRKYLLSADGGTSPTASLSSTPDPILGSLNTSTVDDKSATNINKIDRLQMTGDRWACSMLVMTSPTTKQEATDIYRKVSEVATKVLVTDCINIYSQHGLTLHRQKVFVGLIQCRDVIGRCNQRHIRVLDITQRDDAELRCHVTVFISARYGNVRLSRKPEMLLYIPAYSGSDKLAAAGSWLRVTL